MEKEYKRAVDRKEKRCEENMEGEANTGVIEGGLERLVGQRHFPVCDVYLPSSLINGTVQGRALAKCKVLFRPTWNNKMGRGAGGFGADGQKMSSAAGRGKH